MSSCSPSSSTSEASTTWPLRRGVCRISSEVMEPLLADVPREFNRIFTDGDGACSLHSLFGRARRDLGKRDIFCEDACARGAATLEAFFSDGVRGEAWAILRECVQNNVWKELVWPAVLRGLKRTAQPVERNVRILLQLLQEEEGLWQQLVQHVDGSLAECEERQACLLHVRDSFKDVCRPQYAAFVERLAGALGWLTESPTCEALGECFEEFEDELYVRGTGRTCRLPRVDAPQTRLDALFDARLEFDTIRAGLLEFQGRELFAVKETVRELLGGEFAEVALRPELMQSATALEALEVGHTAGDDAPVWFWDAFEPLYLHATTSGAVVNGWRTAYWLS